MACDGKVPCNRCNTLLQRLSCRPQGVDDLPPCDQCRYGSQSGSGRMCDRTALQGVHQQKIDLQLQSPGWSADQTLSRVRVATADRIFFGRPVTRRRIVQRRMRALPKKQAKLRRRTALLPMRQSTAQHPRR
jgi:hypothetical protein